MQLSPFLEKLGMLFEGFSSVMQFLDIELYSPSFHYSSTYPYAFSHPSCKVYGCLPMRMGPFHYIFIHYVISLTHFPIFIKCATSLKEVPHMPPQRSFLFFIHCANSPNASYGSVAKFFIFKVVPQGFCSFEMFQQ